jgi:hypothetical protein
MEETCFLRGPYREVIRSSRLELTQFCTEVCEEKTSEREAEESPLLETVARERLMKT